MLQSCRVVKSQTKYWTFVITIFFSFLFLAGTGIKLASANTQTESANSLNQTGTLWAPYLEWSLNNPGWSGNPFDVIAVVTFVHGSGETRQTEMFYAGGSTWKFRFTGTRTGQWSFTTSSRDTDLNGHSGNITINPNPNSDIKGFLVNSGNKFAQQVGENGELDGVIFNIWQGGNFPNGVHNWYNSPDLAADLNHGIDNYVIPHGATTLYSTVVANRWFNLETPEWDQHNSREPDFRTFEAMENAITHLHSRGIYLHVWAWGDEDRKQTPIGAGGINGYADRRVQRYIAARLGPLPGWSMNYGFDLGEWVTEAQLESWASYMYARMGWPHLLFSRGFAPTSMGGVPYSSNGRESPEGPIQTSPNGPWSYEEVVSHIDSDMNRPHLYEERFIYLRQMGGGPQWTMDRTRRVMWWNAMAGGVGAFWGVWDGPIYPNPEQMRAHALFWENRFFLDMTRANYLTNGYALQRPSNDLYVFYRENTNSIKMNLSGMNGQREAVAVDTKLAYNEISIGILNPGSHTWTAPYTSDWAIAVGPASGVSPTSTPPIPPPFPTATSTPPAPTPTGIPPVEPSPTAPLPTSPAPSPSPTIALPPPPVPGPLPIIINFQPETAPLMEGQEPDFGEMFGERINGLFYGWNQDNRENARFRQEPTSPDLAHDTLNHLQKDEQYSWEIELVNGEYYVIVVGGDPSYLDSVIKIEVDGMLIADGIPSVENPWVSGSGFVDITDGRLTITSGEDALNNKINYIVITGLGFADVPLRYTLHLPMVSRR